MEGQNSEVCLCVCVRVCVCAAAAILSRHQNGGYGDCCLTAERCVCVSVCVWGEAATAYPICLDKMATICLTNPHSALVRPHTSVCLSLCLSEKNEAEEKKGKPRRASDGAPAKSVPPELDCSLLSPHDFWSKLISPLSVFLSVPVFFFSSSVHPSPSLSRCASSTGLLEEREGQRPAVSHRGVSPQGQYFVFMTRKETTDV